MGAPPVPTASAAWRLAVALVVDICARLDVTAVIVKGPIAAEQGLREPRVPSDLDVLIEPGGVRRVLGELRSQGWQVRAADEDDLIFPSHAVTVFRTGWPIDIDVHHRYKGLERDPASAFSVVHSLTEPHPGESSPFRAPSPEAHAILLALHALRTPGPAVRQRELQRLVHAMRGMDADELLDIATRLGARATARPVLERIGISLPAEAWGVPQAEWRMLTELGDGNERRAALLRGLRWRERGTVVLRWLRPSADVLYKNRDLDERTAAKTCYLYARRLARGLVLLPAALLRTWRRGPHLSRW